MHSIQPVVSGGVAVVVAAADEAVVGDAVGADFCLETVVRKAPEGKGKCSDIGTICTSEGLMK